MFSGWLKLWLFSLIVDFYFIQDHAQTEKKGNEIEYQPGTRETKKDADISNTGTVNMLKTSISMVTEVGELNIQTGRGGLLKTYVKADNEICIEDDIRNTSKVSIE